MNAAITAQNGSGAECEGEKRYSRRHESVKGIKRSGNQNQKTGYIPGHSGWDCGVPRVQDGHLEAFRGSAGSREAPKVPLLARNAAV